MQPLWQSLYWAIQFLGPLISTARLSRFGMSHRIRHVHSSDILLGTKMTSGVVVRRCDAGDAAKQSRAAIAVLVRPRLLKNRKAHEPSRILRGATDRVKFLSHIAHRPISPSPSVFLFFSSSHSLYSPLTMTVHSKGVWAGSVRILDAVFKVCIFYLAILCIPLKHTTVYC